MADGSTPPTGSGGFSKIAIGLVLGALVVGGGVAWVIFAGGDDGGEAAPASSTEQDETGGSASDDDTQDVSSDEAQDTASGNAASFADSATAEVVRDIAPNYDTDGDGAVECIEQNTVGGFTEEELAIIHDNPNASTWPPGLGEKFAAVLEVCIPLRPFYEAEFGSYSFEDPDCVATMTDYVLSTYSWAEFIRKGVMDDKERPKLQAEFDAFVSNGYAAKGCFAA